MRASQSGSISAQEPSVTEQVDMNKFFRYIKKHQPSTGRNHTMMLFKLLEVVRELSGVGGYCTSHRVANRAEVSVYMARKALQQMTDAGLVAYSMLEHRPDVYKRIYCLTNKGLAVDHAFFYGVSGGKEEK